MEDVIREANEGPEYLFVSFDIDTLDPAFVPGTGTPEPGGLLPREAFKILRRLCAESNVVGFELVELAPMLDPTYVSALNANRLIKECMTGIAMRKQGLTDPHYLSPLTKRAWKPVASIGRCTGWPAVFSMLLAGCTWTHLRASPPQRHHSTSGCSGSGSVGESEPGSSRQILVDRLRMRRRSHQQFDAALPC